MIAEVAPRPLAELTTLRTGAAPRRMVEARTEDELVGSLREVWSEGEPWLVLGGGSNVFIGDEPFDGTVIRILTHGIESLPSPREGYERVRVEAGTDWDELVAWTVERGLSGIEAMSGIPGTAGAAPVQNVGAYGQEIAQSLVEVLLVDEDTFEVSLVPAAELGLGFRTSVLKRHYGSVAARSAVILSITLELRQVGSSPRLLESARLREALGLDGEVSPADVREHVLAVRRSKGMVLDSDDPDTHSVGSFFQNAVVSTAFARTLPAACPRWPMTEAPERDRVIPLDQYAGLDPLPRAADPEVKVSNAWLIERAGIRKGFSLPGSRAAVSSKHALALTNRGGATAEEIAELARYIRLRVHSEFGLLMQPEPVLVGVGL